MEPPLHPTPMQRPMMKGKIYVDASNKPTFQGIWGMTHADVTKGGHTNDFKVVRMESVRPDEIGVPVFEGHYLGYFKLTANHQTETVNESFTLQFRGHSNQGYNVYGHGENRFGRTEIVGTVTQTGKMEIFKMLEGTTNQPDPDKSAPPLQRTINPLAMSPTHPPSVSSSIKAPRSVGGKQGAMKSSGGGSSKKKQPKSASKITSPPPPSKNGLPGPVVKILKECVQTLKKSDKGQVFHHPVPPNFRGPKGIYADVIKKPMDLGTVMTQIDTKYRTAAECIEDLRLVFSNAKVFNPDTDPIHALATSLSGKFESYVSKHGAALGSSSSLNGLAAAGGSMNRRNEETPPTPTGSSGSSTSAAAVGASASLSDDPIEKEKKADTDKVKYVKGPGPLTPEEQGKLVEDVNDLFEIWGASPSNERTQAQIFALWCFAKAFVANKDQVMLEGGKRIDIRVDAMSQMRQRQLKDVVNFFLESAKEDQKVMDEPGKSTNRGSYSEIEDGTSDIGYDNENNYDGDAAELKKRYRSDSSGSEDDERYPFKSSRSDPDNSTRRENEQAPSSDVENKEDSSKLEEEDFGFDFEDEDDDEEDEKAKSEVDDGEVDLHWSQAQQEKREREEREKKRAAEQKELEEHRMKIQKQRERERVEEGLKLSRERAAEKARQEAAAREKERLKQKAIEEKMMAQRLIREQQKDTVDLDQVRGNSVLMNLMDASVYDD